MSTGRIEYSLGLETASFVKGVSAATLAVNVLTFAANKFGELARGALTTIEKGGALQDLSNRTRETVGDLYRLQVAFKQSGVDAGTVSSVLQKYRAALGGVGEMGENTAAAFGALGLSIADLSKLNGPEAIEKVIGGLNKLDRNKAAGVAGAIFGRGLSGDMLQLAGDSKDFAENLREVARQSQIMEANAPAFDKLGDTLERLKLRTEGLFLDLAVKITPILQGVLDTVLNPGSLENFGQTLELALTVGFGKAVNFFSHSLQRLFAALPEMFVGVVNVAAGLFIKTMGKLVSGPAGDAIAAMLPGGMGAMLKLAQSQGIDTQKLGSFITGTGVDYLKAGIKAGAAAKVVDIVDVSAEEAALKKRFPGLADGSGQKPGSGFNLSLAEAAKSGAPFSSNFNNFQRIGLGNGSSAFNPDLQAMRRGIEQMNTHLAAIRQQQNLVPQFDLKNR